MSQAEELEETHLFLEMNLVFTPKVNSDQVIEASLGYFINPLVSVLLGFLVLQEWLRRGQQIAVGLAAIGVGYFVWQFGPSHGLPWG
nr:hypothetical protein [Halomicronema hongdechloris]